MKLSISNLSSFLLIFLISNSFWIRGNVIAAATEKELDCAFQVNEFNLYTCINLNLILNFEDFISEAKGKHAAGKSNDDVTAVYLLSSEMRKIPVKIFELFPQLLRFVVHGLDIEGKFLNRESLVEGVFRGAQNLTSIIITGTLLEELKADVFVGAKNLQFLSLEANGIRTIDENAFNGLENLKSLSLNYNLIKKFHKSTFKHLRNLENLSVAGNYLLKFDTSIITEQSHLKTISLLGNVLEVINNATSLKKFPNLEEISMERNVCVDENFLQTTSTDDEKPLSQVKKFVGRCTEESRLKTRFDVLTKKYINVVHYVGNISINLMGSILGDNQQQTRDSSDEESNGY